MDLGQSQRREGIPGIIRQRPLVALAGFGESFQRMLFLPMASAQIEGICFRAVGMTLNKRGVFDKMHSQSAGDCMRDFILNGEDVGQFTVVFLKGFACIIMFRAIY